MSTQKPHAKEPGAALQLAQDLPVRSPQAADKGLVVGISSRVLFDLTESDEVFRNQGVDAYREHQVARENTILQPGSAYALVEKLSRLSAQLPEPGIEVVLLSRNTADTGLRVFKSIECYELKIERAVFCGGETPYRYVQALGCDLFLSTEVGDVRQALEHGVAAATILSAPPGSGRHTEQLRLAFDGDAVLFSDEAERVYQHQGLSDFHEHEKSKAQSPLPPGPLMKLLTVIHGIQQKFPAQKDGKGCPIRTALVTARSVPALERPIHTLREHGVRIDESLFLGGRDKGEFLKAFGADIFFDDQRQHCDSAAAHVTVGHVPHGVANEQDQSG